MVVFGRQRGHRSAPPRARASERASGGRTERARRCRGSGGGRKGRWQGGRGRGGTGGRRAAGGAGTPPPGAPAHAAASPKTLSRPARRKSRRARGAAPRARSRTCCGSAVAALAWTRRARMVAAIAKGPSTSARGECRAAARAAAPRPRGARAPPRSRSGIHTLCIGFHRLDSILRIIHTCCAARRRSCTTMDSMARRAAPPGFVAPAGRRKRRDTKPTTFGSDRPLGRGGDPGRLESTPGPPVPTPPSPGAGAPGKVQQVARRANRVEVTVQRTLVHGLYGLLELASAVRVWAGGLPSMLIS